jgi:hypothetical protein
LISKGIKEKEELSEFIFGRHSRKELIKKLNISEFTFNNRLASLKRKQVVHYKDGIYYLDKRVIPVNEITFKFVIKENEKV